ncbi:MAG: hypothetical protein OXF60_05190 [Gammaproteobacteria bacterium]|nr:hypothetical protein [Gammaproteobacteria bacterium]MCY4219121.1 hypothetical protein [Gammaproteobacteria bacterium]
MPIAESVDSIEQVSQNGILFDGRSIQTLIEFICELMSLDSKSLSLKDSVGDLDTGSDPNNSYDGQNKDRKANKEDLDKPSQGKRSEDQSFEGDTENGKNKHRDTNSNDPNAQSEDKPVEDVKEKDIEDVEEDLRNHPPRNISQEKILTVYNGYVGYIEIKMSGTNLENKINLNIPKEIIEIGLRDELRDQISEMMIIDITDTDDLGVKKENEHLKAFRTLFQGQMGEPLGRIYKTASGRSWR